jgi:hypothetical protein
MAPVVTLLGSNSRFFSNVYIVSVSGSAEGLETRVGYFGEPIFSPSFISLTLLGACTRSNAATFDCHSSSTATSLPNNSTTTTRAPPSLQAFTTHLQAHIFTRTLLAAASSFALSSLTLLFYCCIINFLPSRTSQSITYNGPFFVASILLTTCLSLLLTWVSASMSQQAVSALHFASNPARNPGSSLVFEAGRNVIAFHWALCVLVTFYTATVIKNLFHLKLTPAEELDGKKARRRSEFYGGMR